MEKQAFPSLPGSFSIRFADAMAAPSACIAQRPRGNVREQTRKSTKRQSAELALRVCEAN